MELSSAIVCAISCPIRPNSFSDPPAGGGKWEKFGKAKLFGFCEYAYVHQCMVKTEYISQQ